MSETYNKQNFFFNKKAKRIRRKNQTKNLILITLLYVPNEQDIKQDFLQEPVSYEDVPNLSQRLSPSYYFGNDYELLPLTEIHNHFLVVLKDNKKVGLLEYKEFLTLYQLSKLIMSYINYYNTCFYREYSQILKYIKYFEIGYAEVHLSWLLYFYKELFDFTLNDANEIFVYTFLTSVINNLNIDKLFEKFNLKHYSTLINPDLKDIGEILYNDITNTVELIKTKVVLKKTQTDKTVVLLNNMQQKIINALIEKQKELYNKTIFEKIKNTFM